MPACGLGRMDPPDAGMRTALLSLLVIFGALELLGQTPPPQPVAFRIGSVRFDRPEGWIYSRPADGVRAAQLEKKSSGTPLRIAFTRFPRRGRHRSGQCGSLAGPVYFPGFSRRNTNPRRHGHPSHPCEIKRHHEGRGSRGPHQGNAEQPGLRGNSESPDGLVIAKLTGSKANVAGEEKGFLELVRSAAGRSP